MSSIKRGSGADIIYDSFLYGKSNRNPVGHRVALIERMYMRILTELAVNRFKWTGLPDNIDKRFLEVTLFYFALSVFYYDKRFNKHLALRGGGTNWINAQDNPVGFSVVGNNFQGMNVSAMRETENAGIAVPIWSNYMRMPDLDIVTVYANKFAELDRTIEINSLNARRTKVVVAPENLKLSMLNINRMVDEGQNLIQVNTRLEDLEFIKALDLGIDPDSIEKLHILKVRLWNEAMGYLGIDNANQDKKERLVADEVDANDSQTSLMRNVNLQARQEACLLINKIYGLDVWVEYNTEVEKRENLLFTAAVNQTFNTSVSEDVE